MPDRTVLVKFFRILLSAIRNISFQLSANTMNNSTEGQLNSSSAACSEMVSAMFTVSLSVISAVAFIGNILVATTFIKTQSLRTSTNYFIVNMAVSDLLGPFFNWPLYASEGMLTTTVLINEPSATVACKMGMYFRIVSQVVSVLSLVLIAVDRFIAIVFPLKLTMLNVKVRVFFLSLTWLIPILGGLPYLLFARIIKVGPQTFCRFMMDEGALTIFNGVGFVLFYFIPFIMIIILYSVIKKALKRPRPGNLVKGQSVKRRKQNQKIVKILVAIVSAFFVCWTPLSIYLLLKKIDPALFVKDTCLLLVGFLFYVCPSLSAAINPVILFVFSTNYNQALKSLCSPILSICKRGSKSRGREGTMATQEMNLVMTDTKCLD